MSRQEYNLKILEILSNLIKENPDLRFSQILSIYKFVVSQSYTSWKDEFYIESEEVYNRIINNYKSKDNINE